MKRIKLGNEGHDVIYVGTDLETKTLFNNLWNDEDYRHVSLGSQNYPPKEDSTALCGVYVTGYGAIYNYVSCEDVLFYIMSNCDTMEIDNYDEKELVDSWIPYEYAKEYEWFRK